jgi:hypothetical protein
MGIKLNNEDKLVGVETFYDTEERLPTHSATERKNGDKRELEHEAMLGSWVSRMKKDNSSLTENQKERLLDMLPDTEKKTSENIYVEVIQFINKHGKLPSKSAAKRKIKDLDNKEQIEIDNKEESRLGGWLTTNKKKNFINLLPDQRSTLIQIIRNYKTPSKTTTMK